MAVPTVAQLFGHDNSEVSESTLEDVFGGLHEGPFENVDSECEVVADSPASMNVEVGTGTFCAGGVFGKISAAGDLLHDASHATLDRIDRIILKRDNTNDVVTVEVLKGDEYSAGNAVPPTLTQDATTYEISLAQVLIAATITTLSTSDITDERHDYNVCGWSTGKQRRGIEILNRNLDTVQALDTVAVTTLYTFTIPKAALGGSGGLRLTISGVYFNNSGAGRDIIMQGLLGSTVGLDIGFTGIAADANFRKWRLEILIMNSAANAQKWLSELTMSPPAAADTASWSTTITHHKALAVDTSAEDTSDEIDILFRVQHSADDPSLTCRKEMVVLELLPPV